jgi:transposase
VVYQQTQRWMRAGVFEILVEDVRSLSREFAGRKRQPTAMIVDSRTLQSTLESGARSGYDGAKRRKGSKVHAAVDTLGHLLALHVTAANEQDRAQVERLAEEAQQITGRTLQLTYVDQGYTGQTAADASAQHGIQLEVAKHTVAKRGFVLLRGRFAGVVRWLYDMAYGEEFRADDLNQSLLLPPSLYDWLPEAHLARFLVDVVNALISRRSTRLTGRRTVEACNRTTARWRSFANGT